MKLRSLPGKRSTYKIFAAFNPLYGAFRPIRRRVSFRVPIRPQTFYA